MSVKTPIFLILILLFFYSCKKAATVEANLAGTWTRVVNDHGGSEKWIFTTDNKIYVLLTYEQYGISNDTVTSGSFQTAIVKYAQGNFFHRNFQRIAQITISGFENYKYNQGMQNIWYPAYNTAWEVHTLNKTTLTIISSMYDSKPGGLEIRDFYKE